jgi:NADH-quinone oxidoreductase subunit J
MREGFIRYLPIGILVAALMVAMMVLVVGGKYFTLDSVSAPAMRAADYSNTRELGEILYTVYAYPFEIAAVILLVAIVAAISLTLRRRPNTKYQNPEQQIAVKRKDRVRMVNIPVEKRK